MYELQLTERIAGYSVSMARSGEKVQVQVSGATSTEDGDLHLKYLEGFPQTILSLLDEEVPPSDIKTMVVLISKDLKATVYINETEVFGMAFVKAKRVEKWQALRKDDISGFERIQLKGIRFPDDHAFFCILPLGWDKTFIFDFSPLNDQVDRKIEYDVEKLLGSYFSYLSFSAIHKITASEWEKILNQGWFPFYALNVSTVESIINYAKSGYEIDELIQNIESDSLSFIEGRKDIWLEDVNLAPFVPFLELALDRHKEVDFVSSASILYPKIEAMIRQDFVEDNPDKQGRKQDLLIEHITQKTLQNISALTTFLPDKFKRYLNECYFRDFSVNMTNNPVSRNAVAHGASSIEMFDKKASVLGLLVFSQIAEYLRQPSNNQIQPTANV